MELENGKLRISAGYSLKVPGEADYSSQDKHVGLSLEYDVPDDADVEAILDKAIEVEAQLDTQVKLAVFAALNVEPKEVAEGVLVPNWNGVGTKKAKPAGGGRSKPSGNSGGGNRGKSNGNRGGNRPKANPDDIPTFFYDGMEIQDVRGLKADGTFKPNAPDFREPGRGGKAWWPENGDKDATEGYYEVLDAAEQATF